MKLHLDHILLGINDLQRGVKEFEIQTGVKASFAGVHPTVGSHNALTSLGDNVYLEIIAPVDSSKRIQGPFSGLESLETLSLFGWCVRTNEMEVLEQELDKLGVKHSGIIPGSRIREDGKTLRWKTLFPEATSNVNPFFIEWEDMDSHPSKHRPGSLKLKEIEFALPAIHPMKFLDQISRASAVDNTDSPAGQLLKMSLLDGSEVYLF